MKKYLLALFLLIASPVGAVERYYNACNTTLSAAITTTTATTITVASTACMSPYNTGDTFTVLVDNEGIPEGMTVTGISSNTLTVVRAEFGTLSTHNNAATVRVVESSRAIQQLSNTLPNIATTVSSSPVTLTVPAVGHILQNITLAATATINLPVSSWTGQEMVTNTCQNGTGGFTPTFAGATGVTLKGTYPTPTLTASKCDLCNWLATASNGSTTTTWQFAGCQQNE